MSTTVRPEITKKSPYWIDRHRYYELKHFCLQYPIWKKGLDALSFYKETPTNEPSHTNNISKPVEKITEQRLYFLNRMNIVELAAAQSDNGISSYILKAVTEGISYDCLRTTYDIPCSKDYYYDVYRRFFWLLSQARD